MKSARRKTVAASVDLAEQMYFDCDNQDRVLLVEILNASNLVVVNIKE